MHAAQVDQYGLPPKYVEVPTPEPLSPDSDLVQVNVLAAGLHRFVRSRASGKHYSSKGLPHVPGSDGVGITTEGQKVFFLSMTPATGGSFVDTINVPKKDVTPLPEGADPVQVAALMNPGFSSWMALQNRCENLPDGFSVLIMGVTSKSGRLAIALARHLGAKRVVGVARDEAAMSTLGLEETITLKDPVEQTDYSKLGHVDVILDYVYGAPGAHLLKNIKPEGRVQYVHVGGLAGLDMAIPGNALRSNDLVIRGSGTGAFGLRAMGKEIPALLAALTNAPEQKVRVEKLQDVERVWEEQGERVVFVP